MIPLIEILEDPYKAPITARYVRLSRRVLGIPGSIMFDQTNATESKSVSDF